MSPCLSLILLAMDFDNSTISLACQENSKRLKRNNVPKVSANKMYFQKCLIIGMNLIDVNDIYLDHQLAEVFEGLKWEMSFYWNLSKEFRCFKAMKHSVFSPMIKMYEIFLQISIYLYEYLYKC